MANDKVHQVFFEVFLPDDKGLRKAVSNEALNEMPIFSGYVYEPPDILTGGSSDPVAWAISSAEYEVSKELNPIIVNGKEHEVAIQQSPFQWEEDQEYSLADFKETDPTFEYAGVKVWLEDAEYINEELAAPGNLVLDKNPYDAPETRVIDGVMYRREWP